MEIIRSKNGLNQYIQNLFSTKVISHSKQNTHPKLEHLEIN